MRDIRDDLRERLAELDRRQCEALSKYQEEFDDLARRRSAELGAIDSERAAIKRMLEVEARRAHALPPIQSKVEPLNIQDFIIAKIKTAGPLSKRDLRAAADEAGFRDGRTFHTTLMNITNGGKLKLCEDGRYSMPVDDGGLFSCGISSEEAGMARMN